TLPSPPPPPKKKKKTATTEIYSRKIFCSVSCLYVSYSAVHLSGQQAVLGRDAVLRHNVAVFGGVVVRLVPLSIIHICR
ncbi:hypothetical protein BT096_11845, partial [Corynebacterium diphtheriae]